MFTPLKDLLPRVINKSALRGALVGSMVCEAYRQVRGQILPENIALKTEPKHFRNGVLTLKVTSSSASHLIFFHKKELIFSLNNRLNKAHVSDIRTILF
ncbi:DUF721 domain-containing protein [Candidatus Peregrinibacteria bacterium]|nr:DUF721 domain-containing protein [Candidatus Peregrinibacteria bacterium]